MDFRKTIETYANDPYITCPDTSKCGQCLREQIQSEVSKDFLARHDGEVTSQDLQTIHTVTKLKFKESPLYTRVQAMMTEGKDLKTIGAELALEGIEI